MTEAIAIKNIEDFMNSRRYSFSVKEILEWYSQYFKKGFYVSYTTKDSINNLKEELEFLYLKQSKI